MNYEKNEKLRKEFKFYTGFYGKGLPFECNDGWFDLLYELSEGIQKLIDEGKEDPNFAVHQVKEKFGTLRYYCSGTSEETERLIDIAEAKSAKTCELCGEPGEVKDIGNWYVTLCETCHQEEVIRSQELFNSIKGDSTPIEDKEA